MISVADAWSVEAVDSVRKISQSTQVSWRKQYLSSVHLFTIGVSTIGGIDVIAGPVGVAGNWNKYQYFNESAYVTRIDYERELNMPGGGLVKALADVELDNTSGRFTPRQMGGNSELYTALVPRRPIIINAGFNYGGVDNNIPQFVGITNKSVKVDQRNKTAALAATDYVGFLQNQYLDKQAMFTSVRSDIIIESFLTQAGLSTAQYELDQGINILKFGMFDTGTRFSDAIDEIVKAEYGNFYQTEEGILKFDNRQKWSQYPYFNVQRVINTAQVINAGMPTDDHIINVVEVKGSPRTVQASQLVWQTTGYAGAGSLTLGVGLTEVWVNYNDPVLQVITPVATGTSSSSQFAANDRADGTGSDRTSSVSVSQIVNFAQASKITFRNTFTAPVVLTQLDIWAKPARRTGDIYYKGKSGSSVTAFEEQVLTINNDYIQDASWAASYAEMIIEDFKRPENLQTLTIRAMPELQMGDLISWQGRYWRIYGIRTQIDPSAGLIQDLKLLQRTIKTYFRIGISTIGGSDQIAP